MDTEAETVLLRQVTSQEGTTASQMPEGPYMPYPSCEEVRMVDGIPATDENFQDMVEEKTRFSRCGVDPTQP
jgi:hypothetical protein